MVAELVSSEGTSWTTEFDAVDNKKNEGAAFMRRPGSEKTGTKGCIAQSFVPSPVRHGRCRRYVSGVKSGVPDGI